MTKNYFLTLLIAFGLSCQTFAVSFGDELSHGYPLPAYDIIGQDTICNIFIYSPAKKEGLHVAYLAEKENWQHIGKVCGSDYGSWAQEKSMFNPYVAHASDGTWRLLFSVNDHAPCFGAAYSEDLITWRPQDFPRVKEKGVIEPIMFQMDDGTFDIYFKSKDGSRHYVKADKDFRKFIEAPEESSISDDAWFPDTASIGGNTYKGNMFEIPKVHLDYILQYFHALTEENILNAERMKDDTIRFAKLGNRINATLSVNEQHEKAISGNLLGVFFEDISYAADGGLNAELLQNRDFEYSSSDHKGWNSATAWNSNHQINIKTSNPLSKNNPHYAVITKTDTLYNTGWDGITVSPLENFIFSVYLRPSNGKKNQLLISLISDNGEIYTKEKIKLEGDDWQRYSIPLTVSKDVTKANVRLAMTPAKEGAIDIDMVSLFPEKTFKGHGLRTDIAEAIANLHPKFVRFPGGCMSHGQGINNIYHWQESIGPWQDRKPAMNIWNYHQTRGLGFFEYFQFCEDIGAEPLPVLAAGVPCQNSIEDDNGYAGQQGGIPMTEMPQYCQEIIDLIEWANGDPATSKWAKMRADAGHPAPFNLKYIGIGNEDLISTVFEERYLMIVKTIKEKYPNITVCGTVGPFHYPSADYTEGWKIAKANHKIIDMVDEHYYESPGWFMHHQDYYDNYDRQAPKVYLGEWASHDCTMENALVEALHLCSLERNADVVVMSSYAPLLCNIKHQNWNPNLIYFNNDSITSLTPSYYVQKLWGNHSGNVYISSHLTLPDPQISYRTSASVVKDSNGKTFIKLVNALPSSLTISVNGLNLKDGIAAEGFTGGPGDKHIHNITATVTNNTITLPKYSVMVIEI